MHRPDDTVCELLASGHHAKFWPACQSSRILGIKGGGARHESPFLSTMNHEDPKRGKVSVAMHYFSAEFFLSGALRGARLMGSVVFALGNRVLRTAEDCNAVLWKVIKVEMNGWFNICMRRPS